MATSFPHGIVFVCPVSLVGSVLSQLDEIMPKSDGLDRDPDQPRNYGLPLSADAQNPPTHYLSNFVVTEETRASLESSGLGQIDGVSYWRTSNPDGILQTTNNQDSVGLIGMQFKWSDCLPIIGLQEIIPQGPF